MTKVLGRYELVSKLGAGGMAEVWRARVVGAEGFSKHVVVKRIAAHLSDNSEVVELFKSEARLAARLDHPNLIHVFDFGRDVDGALVLVMELVDGASLRQVLQAAKTSGLALDVHLMARAVALASDGLHAAHTLCDDQGAPLGVVHRDVSPDNLLLSRTGAVKVADFGIARIERQVQLTTAETFRGKPGYAAPEQVLGRPVTAQSDVWALGVTLFELVTGERPHAVDDPGALASATVSRPARRVEDVRPDVPLALAGVIARCLEREPERRWPTAKALADALEAFVARRQPPVRLDELGALVTRLGLELPAPISPKAAPSSPSSALPFVDSEGFEPAGALAVDGQLERFATMAPRPAVPPGPALTPPPADDGLAPFLTPISVPTQDAAATPEPQLWPGERAIASATVAPLPDEAAPRRRAWAWPLVIVAGAVIAAGLEMRLPGPGPLAMALAPQALHPTSAGALVIESKPPGATVWLDGADVGQTPWAGQNVGPGPRRITLKLKGYADAVLELDGGVDWSGTVTLKRR
ncbi:MAG: protein kinase [Myxococcaceae bacterium]|jgi:serine/threonine-protein kinase|nr:protein kinase [Myxococcaceae bacterium]